MALPTWTAAEAEDWLGRLAMNLMLINVSTRKLRRAVRLPEGDLRAIPGDGTSKSTASRRFVALSAQRLAVLAVVGQSDFCFSPAGAVLFSGPYNSRNRKIQFLEA